MVAQLISRQGAENYGMALAAAVLLGVLTASVMPVSYTHLDVYKRQASYGERGGMLQAYVGCRR